MNKKKKSTNISPYPDEAIKRLARAFYPAILACWNSEEGQRSLVGARPLHLLLQDRSVAPKPHWGFHCCAAQTRVCLGRQNRLIIPPAKKKTERSRRGTPCCTYRYRLWSFAGCVLFGGAPCFFYYDSSFSTRSIRYPTPTWVWIRCGASGFRSNFLRRDAM